MMKNIAVSRNFNILRILSYTICLVGLSIIGYYNYKFYHSLTILIRTAVSFLMAIIALNEYYEEQDNYFIFLGLGCMFSNVFDIIHGYSLIHNYKLFIESHIISVFIQNISFYLVFKFLDKDRVNYRSIVFIYAISTIILVFILLKFSDLVDLVQNNNPTIPYLLISIVNILIVIKGFLILKNKKYFIEPAIYRYINIAFLLNIIYMILAMFITTKYVESTTLKVIAHNMLIIYIYYIYKSIVKENLILPYTDIVNLNKELNNKSELLENTNIHLEKINFMRNKMKENLIKREALLNSILNTTTNGWIIFSIKNEINYINKAAKGYFGNEEFLKENIKDVFQNYSKFIKNIKNVFKTKESMEQELYCNNGKIFKCMYSLLTKDECLCIFVDITEEKNIENMLIKNNKSYKSLIKNISAPVAVFDHKYIVDVNDAFENMFKYSKDETIGIEYLKFARRFIAKEDLEYVSNILKMNAKLENNEQLDSNGIFKFKSVTKDGKILCIESHIRVYYEEGERYFLITHKDITEFEKTQEKLMKSEEVYINLLESIPEGIFLEDLENGKLIYINKKLRNMINLNYSNTEYTNKTIYDYLKIHKKYKEVADKRHLKLKNNEVAPFIQMKIIDKFNNILDVEVASIPFNIDNKMRKLTIIRNLEDIKKANFTKMQLLHRIQYDKMKTEFFANISHELKTPLNLIFSSNQLIEMLYKSEKVEDSSEILYRHTKLLKQNSYRLLKLINNVIDVTKMDSGFYKVFLENCNIVDIVENISLSVISYANDKGIDLIFDTDIEEVIMAIDPNIIERIILNLLSNSIKFTNPGGKIYVNIYNKEDQVEIEICDNGIGIPQDKLNIIFERFGQVDKTLYRNLEGSGIGLSLVKSLVDLLNGSISVESEYNVGTKFKVKLPIKLIEIDKQIQPTSKHNYNVERIHVEFSDIYF